MATEVSNQLDRIEGGRDAIVSAVKDKGISIPTDAKIDEIAPYVSSIKTAVLQSKSVIPFTTEQTVTPDDGFDGLSSVTVGAIPSLYVNTSSANATANDILSGKTAYVKGKKVTGNIQTYDYGYAAPSSVVRSDETNVYVESNIGNGNPAFVDDGLVQSSIPLSNFGDATASDVLKGKTFTSADGVMVSGGIETYNEQTYTVSLEHPLVSIDDGCHNCSMAQIIRESEKTVTPSKEGTTVSPRSGRVLSTVKVLGDNNLVAGNIKKDVSIFGVTGTFEGGANIATCTVNIKWSITTRYALITATTFTNGAISRFTSQTGSGTVAIPNVVCGSVVTVYTGTMTSVYGWSYGKAYSQDSYTHALTIPASTGTYTAEIGVLDD